MVGILAKIFIRNNDYKDTRVREKYGILCGILGIALNVILFAGKFIAGTVSGAISITADAFNNLSDAGSSFITLIGFKLAGQKPDPDHPFGHGRMEYLSGLFVSVLILLMAYELIKSAIDKIIHPQLPEFSIMVVIILLASIAVKIYMAFYNSSVGKKIDSTAMAATAKDSLSDTIATSFVLIASVVGYIWKIPIDGYCGVIVGLLILYAGIEAMKDTINPLLGQPPSPELVEEIEHIVMSYEKVKGIHDLVVHDYGPGRLMISLHAEVPYKEDILELHDMIDQIEFDLRGMLNCEPIIHMDPIVDDDDEINDARAEVEKIIKEIDEKISFHDFRMVKGNTHSNLIFDIVVPHGYSMSDLELRELISNRVNRYNKTYFCVIQVDKDYTNSLQ